MAFKPNTAGIRLYLQSTGTADLTPSDSAAAWNTTASMLVRNLVATPGSTALTNTGVAEAVTTNNYDVAIYKGVYRVGAGTIDGLFSAVLRALESNTAANDIAQITVRLIQSSGTVRSVLYAGTSATGSESEWATGTAANRIFPRPIDSHALTSQSATNGDYIEVTVGYRAQNTSSTSRTGTLTHGDDAASDLAVNETGTTALRPWVQFNSGLPTYAAASGNPWYYYAQQ